MGNLEPLRPAASLEIGRSGVVPCGLSAGVVPSRGSLPLKMGLAEVIPVKERLWVLLDVSAGPGLNTHEPGGGRGGACWQDCWRQGLLLRLGQWPGRSGFLRHRRAWRSGSGRDRLQGVFRAAVLARGERNLAEAPVAG